MDTKSKKISLSELKVGIFVVVACIILAVAIFTIGTQVGLLEDTFEAKTYLNTVSGLKAGDIVLLGGVEIGNVTEVKITSPGAIPPTATNQQAVQLIADRTTKSEQLESQVASLRQRLVNLRADQQSAVQASGANSAAAKNVAEQIKDVENEIENHTETLDDYRNDIHRARANIQNIEVYLEIKSEYQQWIRADSNISLGSVGLLGDKYIDISLGRTSQPPAVVTEKVDTWFGSDTKKLILITGERQAGFQELMTGANDILANFQALSEKLQDVMGQFEEGQGSVGKFFTDPAFYNNLNQAVVGARQAVEHASTMMEEFTRGPGTVPRLIQEREIYDRINATTTRLESLMAKVESGEGTLGKLVNDPALYQRSNEVMTNIDQITKRMESGQGTLGQLSTDDKLYQDLRGSINQLNGFMKDVEQGKGTLGKLAKDEELYQNMNKVSSEVVKLIYDFRQNPRKFLTIKFEIF